ncbi:BQ5605_C012g06719 [Microbotryum silenes-dioicae]|uniref:BQ5605_C012g06719 protein n=1 Tax=Microbotryum silenes-dioicae TaxID=796604 RepID=A0A2X0MLA8_9BASI|nr:BQ5605_C012g06719 [Microbotryum silenes-dioicae]
MSINERGQRDGQLDAGLAPPPPPPQRRVRRARIALKPLKPHVSIRDDLGPQTAVCTHCKARHWECERSKLTRHFSVCCSQGKNARSYNNALSFTSLAAHFDQTRPGTQGPRMFCVFGCFYHRLAALIPTVNQRPALAQIWLIDPAEATDTRLGPDGADSHIQRSTLTKLESMLRTKNHFVREFASAKARAGWDTAKESALRLCLPPGRDRRTHNLPTSSTEMAMLICDSDTNTGECGPQDLILQVHGDRCSDGRPKYQGKMASTPTFLFAGFAKLGCQSPETESRSAKVSNRGRYLPVSVLLTKTKRRTKTATMRMKTAGDENNGDGQVKGSRWRVSQNLRLTTTQGINGLTQNPIGRSMTLGSTFKNRTRDITRRYQDATACVVKHGKPPLLITMTYDPEAPKIKAALGPNDKACSRPDLIAQVFEAKSGNKRYAGCFGDECRMNVFVSLLYFVGCKKRSEVVDPKPCHYE